MNRFISIAGSLAVTAVLASACSGQSTKVTSADTEESPSPSRSTASTEKSVQHAQGPTTSDGPVARNADVAGLVDVDGHALSVTCSGSGRPTVVILHGWIDEPGLTSESFYGPLRNELEPDYRVCSYDRANVGQSEKVEGTQTPQMVVDDLDGLMTELGDPGPYLLVGQSAGGMVASAYAVAHPDKVAGIVMVDADFDEEITIEDVGMVTSGSSPCDPQNRHLDGDLSLQRIDVCAIYRWAYERRELRPEVPLVYLAAKQAPWSASAAFGKVYSRKIVPLQKSYAESWSPGKFIWVDSGHEIHYERPEVVGDAVRWVVKEAH